MNWRVLKNKVFAGLGVLAVLGVLGALFTFGVQDQIQLIKEHEKAPKAKIMKARPANQPTPKVILGRPVDEEGQPIDAPRSQTNDGWRPSRGPSLKKSTPPKERYYGPSAVA